ncbi:hypothetical protein BC826DRAFT_1102922 [Russula brevipes]|nr:hypothetical protein BC826DRAFT_1102922 [Russula brevipes]
MFEIDWTTEEDRRRHRTKASTIHGWLRMWRGTLAGNERVRQQGRYEMKVARALREYKQKQKQAQAAGGNSGPLALFNFGSLGKRRNAAPKPSATSRAALNIIAAAVDLVLPPPSGRTVTTAGTEVGLPGQRRHAIAVRTPPKASQGHPAKHQGGVDGTGLVCLSLSMH